MSIWEASLLRAFSWIPSNLRHKICESTCADDTVEVVREVLKQLTIVKPSAVELHPTQVIRTTIYQLIPGTTVQIGTAQSNVLLNRAGNPLTSVLVALILLLFISSLSICCFAALHRARAKSNVLLAHVHAKHDLHSRRAEMVSLNQKGQIISGSQQILQITKERDQLQRMCNQLIFTQQWSAVVRADNVKASEFFCANLLREMKALTVQKDAVEARLTQQEAQSAAQITILESKNAKLKQTNKQIKDAVRTFELEAKDRIAELEKDSSTLYAENTALSQKVKELETDVEKTNAAHLEKCKKLEKQIDLLKVRETRLQQEKAKLVEQDVQIQLVQIDQAQKIEELTLQVEELTAPNSKVLYKSAGLEVAYIVLTRQFSVLENTQSALTAEKHTLIQQLARSVTTNEKLTSKIKDYAKKCSTLLANETHLLSAKNTCSQALKQSEQREEALESEKVIRSHEVLQLKSTEAVLKQEKERLETDLKTIEAKYESDLKNIQSTSELRYQSSLYDTAVEAADKRAKVIDSLNQDENILGQLSKHEVKKFYVAGHRIKQMTKEIRFRDKGDNDLAAIVHATTTDFIGLGTEEEHVSEIAEVLNRHLQPVHDFIEERRSRIRDASLEIVDAAFKIMRPGSIRHKPTKNADDSDDGDDDDNDEGGDCSGTVRKKKGCRRGRRGGAKKKTQESDHCNDEQSVAEILESHHQPHESVPEVEKSVLDRADSSDSAVDNLTGPSVVKRRRHGNRHKKGSENNTNRSEHREEEAVSEHPQTQSDTLLSGIEASLLESEELEKDNYYSDLESINGDGYSSDPSGSTSGNGSSSTKKAKQRRKRDHQKRRRTQSCGRYG